MKKNLLFALVLLTACSGIEKLEEELPQRKTYTITLDAATRALTLEGKTLNAAWALTEDVYVKKGDTWATGSLKPDAASATATLSGELSGISIVADDVLTLQFPKSGDISYSGQVGTLSDIAENFDWAVATVEVASVSGSGVITPKAATTTFTNQQAVVKFTLKDKYDGTTLLSPTAFTVNDGTSDVVSLTGIPAATYTTNGDGVLFIALPSIDSKTVTLTATVGAKTYSFITPSAVSFASGGYYEIGVKMNNTVDLSSLSGNYTAQNGDVLTGTLSGEYKISVAADATITLRDAVLGGFEGSLSTVQWAGITAEGDAVIVLEGSNTVNSYHDNYPGIFVPEGSTLTIRGSGSLVANDRGEYTDYNGAGIGAGVSLSCGNISIEGGTITCKGGSGAAGIGAAGDSGSCGTITISGGTVTAVGGYQAAGIGGGSAATSGNITITSSVTRVTATKGSGAEDCIGVGASAGEYPTVTIGGVTGRQAGEDDGEGNYTFTYQP